LLRFFFSSTQMRITVYASSSKTTPKAFVEEAYRLGVLLAEGGHTCVSGGGNFGGMGSLNRGVKDAGGRVETVIHRRFIVDGTEFQDADELVIVDGAGLAERKQKLVERSDAVIVLPGGLGTWDELWEFAAWRQLGFYTAPLTLVNQDGFYDGFVNQLQTGHAQGLLRMPPEKIMHVTSSAKEALTWCVAVSKEISHPHARKRGSPRAPFWLGVATGFTTGVAGATVLLSRRARL